MLGLLATLIAGLSFFIGGLIALFVKRKDNLIKFSMAVSLGVLVILAGFELLPESIEKLGDNYLFLVIGIAIGFIIFRLLDHFIPYHEEDGSDANLIHIGIVTAIALIIHNIIEGMLLYAYSIVDLRIAFIYAIAAALYHIPLGVNVTVLLKGNKRKMWLYLLILTITPLLGGLVIHYFTDYINDFFLGLSLAINLGMIIYIIIFELLNKIIKNFGKYTIGGIITGVLLILLGMVI